MICIICAIPFTARSSGKQAAPPLEQIDLAVEEPRGFAYSASSCYL